MQQTQQTVSNHRPSVEPPPQTQQTVARSHCGEHSPRMSFIRQRLFSSVSLQNVGIWRRWESGSMGGSGPGSGRNQGPTTPDNGQPAPFWGRRVRGQVSIFFRCQHRSRDGHGGCGPLPRTLTFHRIRAYTTVPPESILACQHPCFQVYPPPIYYPDLRHEFNTNLK